MELIKIQEEMAKRIKQLEIGRRELQKRAQQKANTIAEYRKRLAKELLTMKVKGEVEFEGKKVKNPSVSNMIHYAHGICWQEKLAMELAEAQYKNAVKGLDVLMAELNGWQSIYRHLDSA